MASDPLFLAFQQTLAGRYSIDRELGRGGMGVVYLAREVHLDRLVAIKLLPPDKADDPTLRERFLREVRLAAKLSHPNIIPIYSVDDAGGFVFYVMAFIDGETLAGRVRARGPLPGAEGARMLREVAWALSYAHSQGFVHRDVKPDNILIETATGRVLVADFGIAAAMSDVAADGISGTPEFMSPEQVLGEAIDARSDLYGVGATAFFAFSGRFPFEGKSATEVLAKQVTEPAPPLASLGLPVPRKLAALVDRCLAKDREHRPASANALAEQLTAAIEQRREVPAALRAFVKRNARLNGSGTFIMALGLVPFSFIMGASTGPVAGFTTFLLGSVALPFAYCTATARRLLLQGFTHQDLGPAFKVEIDQTEEELALGGYSKTTRIERVLAVSAKIATVGWVGAMLYNLARIRSTGDAVMFSVGLFGALALANGIAYISLASRNRDVETTFWSKLWTGRVGTAAFAFAKRILGNRARTTAMTHRATELSLGLAAEQLYESLPRESRLALANLPPLLERLQNDAQRLRKRYDAAQQAVAESGDGAAPAYAELREHRDAAHRKLGEAVGAL
jgi:predicted Ser/Thr protein kinase